MGITSDHRVYRMRTPHNTLELVPPSGYLLKLEPFRRLKCWFTRSPQHSNIKLVGAKHTGETRMVGMAAVLSWYRCASHSNTRLHEAT